MSKASIRAEISKYTNKVNELNMEIIELTEILRQAYEFESAHKSMSTKSNSKLERERFNLSNLSKVRGVKTAFAYRDDMLGILGGSYEQSYLENISNISKKITKKIDDTEEKIRSLQAKVNEYKEIIRELKNKLRHMH